VILLVEFGDSFPPFFVFTPSDSISLRVFLWWLCVFGCVFFLSRFPRSSRLLFGLGVWKTFAGKVVQPTPSLSLFFFFFFPPFPWPRDLGRLSIMSETRTRVLIFLLHATSDQPSSLIVHASLSLVCKNAFSMNYLNFLFGSSRDETAVHPFHPLFLFSPSLLGFLFFPDIPPNRILFFFYDKFSGLPSLIANYQVHLLVPSWTRTFPSPFPLNFSGIGAEFREFGSGSRLFPYLPTTLSPPCLLSC